MALNITVPEPDHLTPKLAVIGVGGAGGNAVNNMIASDLQGVEFIAANTDAQALAHSQAPRRIQLGPDTTRGLGAGRRPEVGQAAAEEAIEELTDLLGNIHMLFIAAGMGGGTGTGAAPVIARLARDMDILTVGVVTKPFHFEGNLRMKIAETGIESMQQFVNTLIVIPNQNLFRVANEHTTCTEAFAMADEVLQSGVRGVTDLIVVPGRVNLDFSDIRTVMGEMGKAMMGTGEAEGEGRELAAAEAAISNPLLEDMSLQGAKDILINVTSGDDLTLLEIDKAVNRIREEAEPEANIMFGSVVDPDLEGKVRISVVATGIGAAERAEPHPGRPAGGADVTFLPGSGPALRGAAAGAGPAQGQARTRVKGAEAPPVRPPIPARRLPPAPGGTAAEPAAAGRAVPGAPTPPLDVRETPLPRREAPRREGVAAEPETVPVEPAAAAKPRAVPSGPAAAGANGPRGNPPEKPAPGSGPRKPARRFPFFGQGGGAGRVGAAPAGDAPAGRKEPPRSAAQRTEEPRLEGVGPGDRLKTSQVDDDLLEIPAFLRRQVN